MTALKLLSQATGIRTVGARSRWRNGLIVVTLVGVAIASSEAGESRLSLRSIAHAYVGGDDSAAREIAGWDVNRLSKAANALQCEPRPQDRLECQAITELLVDVAAHSQPWDSKPYLDAARTVLKRLVDQGSADERTRRLYVLVAWALHGHLWLDDLNAHLAFSRSRFPTDPELLASSGMLFELYASSRLTVARQAALAPSRTDSLARAEQFYRAALAEDAGNAEIMLRLGRVLSAQARCDEALKVLAVPEASETTAYMALLFGADAHRCLGQVADAARAYELAARRCPACSTPLLGLAMLALPSRDRGRSAAYAQEAATLRGDDPWWSYDYGPAPRLSKALDEFKVELRHP